MPVAVTASGPVFAGLGDTFEPLVVGADVSILIDVKAADGLDILFDPSVAVAKKVYVPSAMALEGVTEKVPPPEVAPEAIWMPACSVCVVLLTERLVPTVSGVVIVPMATLETAPDVENGTHMFSVWDVFELPGSTTACSVPRVRPAPVPLDVGTPATSVVAPLNAMVC
jgi:hypothetical protein